MDHKDLFEKVENAIAVYTSEMDHSAGGADPEVLLQDRLREGRERLDAALETLALLCEPVEPPEGELEHIRYFCGNTEIPSHLKSGNRRAPRSIRRPSSWCAPTPTSPTNWKPPATATPTAPASNGNSTTA